MTRTFTRIATRLALAFAGAGLAVAGAVLLLRAAWLAMALPLGPIWTSVILGGALLATGAVVAAVALHRRRRPALLDSDLVVLVTTAFFQGLAAGRSVRER